MIRRALIQEVIQSMEYFPVIGIIGPRQSGKTTLVKSLSGEIERETIYLDLENPKDVAKIADPILFIEQNEDKCIIIDEVQHQPHLFNILRSMVDQKREPGRFIILGSASPVLIRGSADSLAGRVAYLELDSLHYNEISPNYSMNDHWFRGGYPDALLAKTQKAVELWHRNYIRTYVERDLPQLGLNVSAQVLRNFWTMLAHIVGGVINQNNLSKSLGVTNPTISKYIHFMEEAFLIKTLQPFHFNIKKRLVKAPKLYFKDTGVLHHLLNVAGFDDLLGRPYLGNSWENYVILQVMGHFGSTYDYYFYSTHQGAECDLVLVKGLVPEIGIEIKYSSAPRLTKGSLQAMEDLQTKQNYVITPSSDRFLIKKEIEAISLPDFLSL